VTTSIYMYGNHEKAEIEPFSSIGVNFRFDWVSLV
jgi:hypothetical protein